jgi:hypothetical protein
MMLLYTRRLVLLPDMEFAQIREMRAERDEGTAGLQDALL